MEIKRLSKNDISINDNALVSFKKMNNVIEVMYCSNQNKKANIINIDKDYYALVSTGEVKEKNHIITRAQDLASVSHSLKRLRDYINYNVVDTSKCLWVTLTYKENMTDEKRLYLDFNKFIKRMHYKYGEFEYIVCCEPQARGAWHMHVIFIFNRKKPYIDNEELASVWQNGFTLTKSLKDIDNVGAYLSAYLGDLDLDNALKENFNLDKYDIKNITSSNADIPKQVLKGARLYLYPPKFNLYRVSRGIKKPPIETITYKEAKEKIGKHIPTYSTGLSLLLPDTNNSFNKKIIYEYYNTSRQ